MPTNMQHVLRRSALLIAASALTAARVSAQSGDAATAAPKGAAIYTNEQAERGSQVFGYRCITCHQRTDYANPDFRLKWNGQTAYALFERIRSSMPDTDPGSYGINEYQEVVAYILKMNGLPAGTASFAGDSVAKATVLDFSLYKPVPSHHTEVVHAPLPVARVALHQCCPAVRTAHGGGTAGH
jgi:mono/diheme cytochrome c family protein